MTRARAIAGALGLSIITSTAPVLAGQQVYTYAIVHPIYGEIGTFINSIDRTANVTRIESQLRVAVTLLGVVAYRENHDGTEILQGDRLVSLQTVTDKDGRHFDVRGEAQGDQFLIYATAGTFAAPATVSPSDPWLLKRTGDEVVVSTSTGRVDNVHISGGEHVTVAVGGAPVFARHFVVMGEKRQEVWLDGHDVPVMFRTVENGTPIDFVLKIPTAE